MEKRLSCAASSLGIRLDIEVCKDAEALSITFKQTPSVLHNGEVIFTNLARTEEIETWLKNLI